MTDDERADLELRVRHDLWRLGDLSWKADEGQQSWADRFRSDAETWVWLIGRQRGKSFRALMLALELALRQPGSIIRYCAKTKESAWGIVAPNLKAICEDKPDDVRIQPSTQRADVLEIGEGSELVVFGTDAQSFDRGRGPRTHLQLFDECGFYQDLERVEAALLPSLQTTQGKALYLSTPPESMGHPYVSRIRAAKATGHLVHDTFWSNPRINHEAIIRQEAARLGMTREELLASTYFRREYLAELVTEESRAAVPAWATVEERSVKEVERPKFFDAYVAIDPGGQGDPHAALFGYLWFERGTLVIEDEIERRGANTLKFAELCKAKERELWGADKWDGKLRALATMNDLPDWLRSAARPDAPPQPYLRVGDNDSLVLTDLLTLHGIAVLPTRKDHKHLAANEVDMLFRQGRILVHPRCKRLRAQLYTTVWNKQRTEWERTDLDHGDLVDDLFYMARNVNWHRDPRPANYGVDLTNAWLPPPPDPMASLKAMAGLKRKR